ncbi:S10I protein, partial [Polypterus senegalus]
ITPSTMSLVQGMACVTKAFHKYLGKGRKQEYSKQRELIDLLNKGFGPAIGKSTFIQLSVYLGQGKADEIDKIMKSLDQEKGSEVDFSEYLTLVVQ